MLIDSPVFLIIFFPGFIQNQVLGSIPTRRHPRSLMPEPIQLILLSVKQDVIRL